MAKKPSYEELEQRTRELEEEVLQCRETEKDLLKRGERFRRVVESAREAIVMVDGAGVVTYWNPGAQEIFGYSSMEMTGSEAKRIVPERYHSDYARGLAAFRAAGANPSLGGSFTSEAVGKDGREFPVEFSLSEVPGGGRWCGMAVIRDITERRRVEEAVRQSMERLQVMVDNAHCPMLLGDLETLGIMEVNRAAMDLYGFRKNEFLRMKFPELSAEPGGGAGDGSVPHALLEAPVSLHRKKDGTAFPVEIEFSVFMWRARKAFCAVIGPRGDSEAE